MITEKEFQNLKRGDNLLVKTPGLRSALMEVEVLDDDNHHQYQSNYIWCLTADFGVFVGTGRGLAGCILKNSTENFHL